MNQKSQIPVKDERMDNHEKPLQFSIPKNAFCDGDL